MFSRVCIFLVLALFGSGITWATQTDVLHLLRANESSLYFSAENYKAPKEKKEQRVITQSVFATIQALPEDHTNTLQSLHIRNQAHVSRGMANGKYLVLHTQSIDTEDELKSVTIHEIGHVVDLGKLQGESTLEHEVFSTPKHTVQRDDKSVKFYALSWKNPETHKSNTERKDFVSGYAMTNIYEDFAESYAFYVLHGDKFRALMQDSFVLRRKYHFMKYFVFDGAEFQTEKTLDMAYQNTIFDTTLLPLSASAPKALR